MSHTPGSLRIVLISSGASQFATLHETCVRMRHKPVAYVYSRSLKQGTATDPGSAKAVCQITEELPPGVDLILPGGIGGLAAALGGYRPDLIVVHGFNWKIPTEVRKIARLGAINIHPSLLPRYRGPAPVLHAIRNGDPEIGVTVHRMDDGFDTGPVLARRGGVPLAEDVTQAALWTQLGPVVADLLSAALTRILAGDPGEPQQEAQASHAGMLEPEFFTVDWGHSAAAIHNQVRTIRFIGPGRGPLAEVGGGWLRVLRTSLTPAEGIRRDCADGPIWLVETVAAEPPVS